MTDQSQKKDFGICPLMSGADVLVPHETGTVQVAGAGYQVNQAQVVNKLIACAGPGCQLWRGTIEGGGDVSAAGSQDNIIYGCSLRGSASVDIGLCILEALKGLKAPIHTLLTEKARG